MKFEQVNCIGLDGPYNSTLLKGRFCELDAVQELNICKSTIIGCRKLLYYYSETAVIKYQCLTTFAISFSCNCQL